MAAGARHTICISRLSGADGELVGRTVSEQLALRYVDEDVVAQAAEWADLDPEFIASVERRKTTAAKLLGSFGESSIGLATADLARTLPGETELRSLITEVLRSFGRDGKVVIVAHAASFVLSGSEVLRVLVTASPETRAERLAAEHGLDTRQAARRVKDDDGARADYLKRFYGIERELPTHYDLVVNTDVLAAAEAGTIVAAAT